MADEKRTPGPWTREHLTIVGRDRTVVCTINRPTGDTTATAIHDGDLIAVAPEMAAAIRAFVRDRATCPTANGADLEAWEMMTAVLTKIGR